MKRIILLLIALTLASSPVWAQQRKKEPKNKFGAIHYTHSGGSYTLQSSTDSSSVTEPLIGAGFFYERVFQSRFSAGLKYSGFLERSLTQTVDGTSVTTVEKTAMTTLDFKAYFKDHLQNGMKPFLGVAFGTYTPASTVTTLAATGNTEGNTTASVPITSLSAGFDYVLDFGGVRAEVGSVSGKRRDLSGHDTYSANYQFDGTSIAIGVFSFF
ncbi:MAG: hypothetical protein RRB13_03540 [bacterium]|nr:hypothetical protein [bacterium]